MGQVDIAVDISLEDDGVVPELATSHLASKKPWLIHYARRTKSRWTLMLLYQVFWSGSCQALASG